MHGHPSLLCYCTGAHIPVRTCEHPSLGQMYAAGITTPMCVLGYRVTRWASHVCACRVCVCALGVGVEPQTLRGLGEDVSLD